MSGIIIGKEMGLKRMKLKLCLALVLLLCVGAVDAQNITWLSANYSQKIPVTVTYAGTDDISDYYQINFTLDGTTYNLSGLRIAKADNSTTQAFWNESALSGSTKVWVNATGITNTTTHTFWAYINGTGNYWNAESTFKMWDNFSSKYTKIVDDTFCSIVINDSTYYLFCTNLTTNSITRYHSTSLESGWVYDGAVLEPSATGWDDTAVGVPAVWVENGTWHMLYRGKGAVYQIGYANSTDGLNWVKYSGNPVIQNGTGVDWDNDDLDPWGVIKVGDTYYLYYNTITSPREVGIATSTNLTVWTKDANNPIFDNDRFCAFAFKYGGYYYIMVPHYTSGTDYTEFELYRDTQPTFYSTSRTFIASIKQTTDTGWDSVDIDTPALLTDTIFRDSFPNNELWVVYAGYNTSWAEGVAKLRDDLFFEHTYWGDVVNGLIHGAYYDGDSRLYVDTDVYYIGLRSAYNLTNGCIDLDAQCYSGADATHGEINIFWRYSNDTDFSFAYVGSPNRANSILYDKVGNTYYSKNTSSNYVQFQEWHNISVCFYDSNAEVYVDGELWMSSDSMTVREPSYFGVSAYQSTNYFDNVRARRYVEPTPIIEVGAVRWGGGTKLSLNDTNLVGTNGLCDYGTTYPAVKANITVLPETDIVKAVVNAWNPSATTGEAFNLTVTNTTANENATIVIGGLTQSSYQIQRSIDNYYWNGSGWQATATTVSPNASGYIVLWNEEFGSDAIITGSPSVPPTAVRNPFVAVGLGMATVGSIAIMTIVYRKLKRRWRR